MNFNHTAVVSNKNGAFRGVKTAGGNAVVTNKTDCVQLGTTMMLTTNREIIAIAHATYDYDRHHADCVAGVIQSCHNDDRAQAT